MQAHAVYGDYRVTGAQYPSAHIRRPAGNAIAASSPPVGPVPAGETTEALNTIVAALHGRRGLSGDDDVGAARLRLRSRGRKSGS
jgi:hypothetical protein